MADGTQQVHTPLLSTTTHHYSSYPGIPPADYWLVVRAGYKKPPARAVWLQKAGHQRGDPYAVARTQPVTTGGRYQLRYYEDAGETFSGGSQ